VLAVGRALPAATGAGAAVTLLAVGALLLLATAVAGALPALRAGRVDPALALRED
jgi:ABC-type antimicrobial peptide transport system permease subunit